MPKNGINQRFVAIYARQSVDKKDSVSIETQIDDCKSMTKSKYIRVYQDKGFSGKNTDRPDVTRLIHDIENDLIEQVIVYKLDRISRNINDFYRLYEVMKQHDCQFISKNESFDTSNAIGRAMMGILAVFAQMERENTQQRILDNYEYRIKQGSWASGKAPYGFKNDKIDGVKTLTPIPEEIEVVKWMFETYANSPSISLGQIQSKCIAKGVKGHQSKVGFSRTTISHILTNPIYAKADELLYQYYQSKLIEFINDSSEWDGTFAASVVGKNGRSLKNEDLSGIRVYITNVKGVIDSRTFIMVQERMEQNQQVASDNLPNTNLQELSGLLKCYHCESAIKMQAKPTLTCTGRGQKKICDKSFKGIRLEIIQAQVDEEIEKYLSSLHQTNKEKQTKRNKVHLEIQKLEKQLNNLIEISMISDEVSDVVKKKINDLTIKIKEKQIQLKTDDVEDIIALRVGMDKKRSLSNIFDNKGNLLLSYKDLDNEHKQGVLRVLVNRILVKDDGSIVIDWKE